MFHSFGSAAPRTTFLALFALFASLSGCNCDDAEGDIRAAENPVLQATPDVLSFSAATPGSPQTLTAEVKNVGSGTLTSLNFTIDPSGTPFSFAAPGVTSLEENESATVEITYAPDDSTADEAKLVVTGSNNQRAEVRLTAETGGFDLQCVPPISFGPVEVGTEKTLTTSIQNAGLRPVTIEAVELEFGDPVEITTSLTLPAELAPLESIDVELVYDAAIAGSLTDTLKVSIAETSDVFDCRVTGTTSLPLIDIPLLIDFGFVEPGTTVSEIVPVRNAGDFDLTLSEVVLTIDSDQDAFAVVNAPVDDGVIVAPDTVYDIEISYTAGDSTSTGTAVFFSDDPTNSAVNVSLLGRPSQPDIAVNPMMVDFGVVAVEERQRLDISVFNNGNLPLEVGAMTLTGDDVFTVEPNAAFAPTTGGTGTLAPFDQVDVSLAFEPIAEDEYNATLTIPSNDPDTPTVQIELTGRALEGGSCRVTLQPDPVAFGVVTRGNSAVVPVLVTNVGSGPCTYTGASATGIFNSAFAVTGSSAQRGDMILPGGTMTVDVEFFPTLGELDSAPLETNGTLGVMFTDPSAGGTAVFCGEGLFCQMNPMDPFRCVLAMPPDCGVSLTGLSAPAQIRVIPGEVDFGLVTVGCGSQATNVSVYSTGFEAVDISDIRLEGCSDEFSLRGTPVAYPVEVDGSGPLVVQVVYHPETAEADMCELVVVTDTEFGSLEERVPLVGEGTTVSDVTDVHEQVAGRKVDVLFLLDISGSMDQELNNVADRLTEFFEAATLLNTDFHVGVSHLGFEDSILAFGRQNEAGELVGNPPYLTRDTPNFQALFASRVRFPNLGGGNTEAGLVSAEHAFTDPYSLQTTIPCLSDADCSGTFSTCSADNVCGGRNVGFLRDDAALEIVIVSDEEDQSPQTPSYYVDYLQSLKGFRNNGLLHVSVIVGANIQTNVPENCSGTESSAQGGPRYDVVAQATGGLTGSICADDYGPFLADIGNRAFGLQAEFFLSRVPDPTTIVVSVDGSEVADDTWTFDASTNSIIFEPTAIPAEGATISIDYEAFCFP